MRTSTSTRHGLAGKVAALCLAACALLTLPAQAEIKVVDVKQAEAMSKQGALVLDVREQEEYAAGHINGSKLIPLGQLAGRVDEIRQHEGKPVVIVCRSGRRSEQAAGVLEKLGFRSVHNVQGGMLAWEKADLPVEKR